MATNPNEFLRPVPTSPLPVGKRVPKKGGGQVGQSKRGKAGGRIIKCTYCGAQLTSWEAYKLHLSSYCTEKPK